MTEPIKPSGVLRALAPAGLVALILVLMIWGGIGRNRARVDGAVERHAGVDKLATYGAHAVSILEARRGVDGTWRCQGKRDRELTRRILLNLRGTAHAQRPSLSADIQALEIVSGGAVGKGGGGDPASSGPDTAGPGSTAWFAEAYDASLNGGDLERFLAELGPPTSAIEWSGEDLLRLGIRLHLLGEKCLRESDPCRGLDAGVASLARRMDPAGGWSGEGVALPGSCPGSSEEATAAAVRALDTYSRVLALRAAQTRPVSP